MATVDKSIDARSLRIVVRVGETLRTRLINNINPALADDKAYDIATGLGSLIKYETDSVGYRDTISLVQTA